jgi:hypothetical protein
VATLPKHVSAEKWNQKSVGIVCVVPTLFGEHSQNWQIEQYHDNTQQQGAPVIDNFIQEGSPGGLALAGAFRDRSFLF